MFGLKRRGKAADNQAAVPFNDATLPHLRGLLEVLRLLRSGPEPAVVLGRIAEILAEKLGFRAVYTPEIPVDDAPGSWHPEDALIAAMRGADGSLLGILSLDEPLSGIVPGEEDLELLAAVAEHVALAIEAAQASAAAARDRASLANLLEVSSRLTSLEEGDSVFDAISDGIRRSLGFEKVVVAIADGAGRFMPRGSAGWAEGDPGPDFLISADDMDAILDPAFERGGCYLLSHERPAPGCAATARATRRSATAAARTRGTATG